MMTNEIELLLAPEQFLPLYVKNTKDIYEHRHLLKQLLVSEYALNYLLDILIAVVKNRARFRTLDCLRVIRAILKNNPFELKLGEKTINKLFYLHQAYIFHKNQQVSACANVLVKSQSLDDESVSWIISNWENSEHLLNRLLRYPVKHPLVTQWATEMYQKHQLRDRKAELIALLIDENIPSFIEENKNTIIWAIYYSRVPDEVKQRLLMERFSVENLESLWKVSVRLKYSNVIELMHIKIREKPKNGG